MITGGYTYTNTVMEHTRHRDCNSTRCMRTHTHTHTPHTRTYHTDTHTSTPTPTHTHTHTQTPTTTKHQLEHEQLMLLRHIPASYLDGTSRMLLPQLSRSVWVKVIQPGDKSVLDSGTPGPHATPSMIVRARLISCNARQINSIATSTNQVLSSGDRSCPT